MYLPSVSDWGVWRGTPLEVVGDNHSPASIYVRQWDIAPGAVSACCTCYMRWL